MQQNQQAQQSAQLAEQTIQQALQTIQQAIQTANPEAVQQVKPNERVCFFKHSCGEIQCIGVSIAMRLNP
jgi:hypothetical protein